MNVASLELSKELYELSGWVGTEHNYSGGKASKDTAGTLDVPHVVSVFPAYDADYLFGQLLVAGSFSVRYVSPSNPLSMDLKEWYGKCIAFTPDMKQQDYPIDGLPANVMCRLAIELFKQGKLSK